MPFWKRDSVETKKKDDLTTRVGSVLRKMGLATDEQLDAALVFQNENGGLFLDILVAQGVLTEQEQRTVLDVQEKMRQGDPVAANVKIIQHQTRVMARRSSTVTLMAVPTTNVG